MATTKIKDTNIQEFIGLVLRVGIVVSMLIVLFGGAIYVYRHGNEPADYTTFKGVPDFVHSVPAIWYGILAFRGRAIIQAGILLLICTPVLRILVSGVGFLLEKDYLYTGVSVLVLLIIIISALTGHGG